MKHDRIVVVGAGLAGLRTAEALREQGFMGELVLVGAEDLPPYDRPPLSKQFLSGRAPASSLALAYALDARLWLGLRACSLDAGSQRLTLDDGRVLHYDALVVATGAQPMVPASIDRSLRGVHTLRTAADAVAMRADLQARPRHVVVIGAGFIGMELASTCRALALPVTLVDVAEVPLATALGRRVATSLLDRHRTAGAHFRLGVVVRALMPGPTGEVAGVELTDGSTMPADVVVVAIGVRPDTAWLAGSAVPVDDGIVCQPDLAAAGVENIVAVGDVARWLHPLYGQHIRVEHWHNAVAGAQVAAATLLGGTRTHAAVPSFWSDQLGLTIQGIGLPALADEVDVDDADGLLAVYRREGRIVGAVTFERPRRLLPIRRELTALAESLAESLA